MQDSIKALTDEGGHCITLARAFIALCRLLKIPAREQTGAIAVNPLGASRYENRTYNEAVFGHTWAEIFISDLGWIPVEFHGISIGTPALTEANVQSKALRHKVLENSEPYFDFFFGHLDCFHVVCSNSAAKEVPQVIVYEEADNSFPRFIGRMLCGRNAAWSLNVYKEARKWIFPSSSPHIISAIGCGLF